MIKARLTKMNLRVDHARKHVETTAIDHSAGRRIAKVAQGSDSPVHNADVTRSAAIMVDHDPAFEEHIEGLGHEELLERP